MGRSGGARRQRGGSLAARRLAPVIALPLVLAACSSAPPASSPAPDATSSAAPDRQPDAAPDDEGDEEKVHALADEEPTPEITLAFAGDTHMERRLSELLGRRGSDLGPLARQLREADLAMLKLETALARPGERAPKELERPGVRYWFRADPADALALLARSGVDMASMANNHAGDFGVRGLRQAAGAAADSPVSVLGIGRDVDRAFAVRRTEIRGVRVGVLAADASTLESAAPVWTARPGSGVGMASARGRDTDRLLAAVRGSAETDDVTVVFMHWGTAVQRRPDDDQRRLAADLAEAGADVVVGSGAHVTQGAGMLGDTYVAYGLGDFAWYHGRRPRTGVLTVRVRGGEVVGDEWTPGLIPEGGGVAQQLGGRERREAVQRWQRMRRQAALAAPGEPGTRPAEARRPSDGLPAYESQVSRLGPALRERMTGSSHDPATCPVSLDDLRLLEVSRVGFDGTAKSGRLVVHRDVADETAEIFGEIYDARFPLRRVELVDEYGADDDRSMRANNSSAYNCRTVAGTDSFSNHAYGRAIDINPVQNPYVRPGSVEPRAGRRFTDVPRSPGSDAPRGAIVAGDPVMTAFVSRGWTWGRSFSTPDYQHFAKD